MPIFSSKNRFSLLAAVSGAAVAATCTFANSAAAVECASLTNPVYLPATSLVKPFFARVANKLATASTTPFTIIYQSKGTCAAYSQVQAAPPIPMTGTATYWDGVGEQSCTLPPAGATPDLAMGDLTWETCFPERQPATIAATQLFVQPVGFVVPLSSTQVAITAEECNVLFRYGAIANKQISPWNDPLQIVIRNPNSSTQWLNGLACGVRGNQFSGNLTNTNLVSADVLAKVVAANSTPLAEKTIGILATDYYDSRRDQVKMLAFQSYGQKCSGAFLPDSSATSFDKRNVRDGHYGTFGYTWAMTRLDANKVPVSPLAKALVDFISNTDKVNEADPIADAAKIGLVPTCAMSVRRTTDGGSLERYSPPAACGCYFEAQAGKSSCDTCDATTKCSGTNVCRFGFCEAK